MTTIFTESSALTVAKDLVTDRSIIKKVLLSILLTLQVISCWSLAGLYVVGYYIDNNVLEMALTWGIFLVGTFLVPGIANAVVYQRRWQMTHRTRRNKTIEENKEAWICLRLTLTLLGLSPVGRYIETITAIRKIVVLERKYLPDSMSAEKDQQRLNPSVGDPSAVSMLSGHVSESGAGLGHLPESGQHKVRRARRQFRRCEHDGALVALVSGVCGAGTMAVTQIFLFIHREQGRYVMRPSEGVGVLACTILSLLWLAAALTHYYPGRIIQSEPEFERGVNARLVGLLLLFSSHLVLVTLRCLTLGLFTALQGPWVFFFLLFHWAIGFIILVCYRSWLMPRVASESVSQRFVSWSATLGSYAFFALVGIFGFINANEGKTRVRYLLHYALYYVENVAMIVPWYILLPHYEVWYRLPCLLIVLCVFWLSFILLQLYYRFFHPGQASVSIFGICGNNAKERHNEMYAVQGIREPVFGVPVAQTAVPFWQERDDVFMRLDDGSRAPSQLDGNRPIVINRQSANPGAASDAGSFMESASQISARPPLKSALVSRQPKPEPARASAPITKPIKTDQPRASRHEPTPANKNAPHVETKAPHTESQPPHRSTNQSQAHAPPPAKPSHHAAGPRPTNESQAHAPPPAKPSHHAAGPRPTNESQAHAPPPAKPPHHAAGPRPTNESQAHAPPPAKSPHHAAGPRPTNQQPSARSSKPAYEPHKTLPQPDTDPSDDSDSDSSDSSEEATPIYKPKKPTKSTTRQPPPPQIMSQELAPPPPSNPDVIQRPSSRHPDQKEQFEGRVVGPPPPGQSRSSKPHERR